MTPDEAHKAMKKIRRECVGDPERAHVLADQLLCRILRMNGFYHAADEFDKIEKHYG